MNKAKKAYLKSRAEELRLINEIRRLEKSTKEIDRRIEKLESDKRELENLIGNG